MVSALFVHIFLNQNFPAIVCLLNSPSGDPKIAATRDKPAKVCAIHVREPSVHTVLYAILVLHGCKRMYEPLDTGSCCLGSVAHGAQAFYLHSVPSRALQLQSSIGLVLAQRYKTVKMPRCRRVCKDRNECFEENLTAQRLHETTRE